MDWYTQDEFVRGNEYVDADGELCLVYAGILPATAARDLPGITDDVLTTSDESEAVLIFVVEQTSTRVRFYGHTKADADLGHTFISFADETAHPSSRSTDVKDFES